MEYREIDSAASSWTYCDECASMMPAIHTCGTTQIENASDQAKEIEYWSDEAALLGWRGVAQQFQAARRKSRRK
jgi:hypothetical protein